MLGKLICGLALASVVAGVVYVQSKVTYRCTRAATITKVTLGQPLGE